MKIFFDTEFKEDGKTIELISIGLVRQDGSTYYAEAEEFDWENCFDPWLLRHVKPHLTGKPKSKKKIANELIEFVGPNPEFWAYYAAYDWVALCQLYGRMIDLPKNWPMYCRDIKQLSDQLSAPKFDLPNLVEHNALHDAIHSRLHYIWLKGYKEGKELFAK